eukprot:FR741693.1.p1 GENE.FR741693.1~~FR741693.1.p1  ORF type:complete len:161 (+),score=37.83 FR741693.1:64-483(+)
MLNEAFTPQEALTLTFNEEQKEPEPLVKPPEFIDIAKGMILNFGNVKLGDGEDLEDRIQSIVLEAEQVSVSIFGESMTHEEQQDRMWKDGTVSVFDLETLEQQAEAVGETMPWHGEVDEQMFLDKMTFDKKGVKKIGGQ